MKIIYRCDFCNNEYSTINACMDCEESHLEGTNKIKYQLMRNPKTYLCDYCKHSYYSYGTDIGCEKFKQCGGCINDYVLFEPVEPLHDKRKNGGV